MFECISLLLLVYSFYFFWSRCDMFFRILNRTNIIYVILSISLPRHPLKGLFCGGVSSSSKRYPSSSVVFSSPFFRRSAPRALFVVTATSIEFVFLGEHHSPPFKAQSPLYSLNLRRLHTDMKPQTPDTSNIIHPI